MSDPAELAKGVAADLQKMQLGHSTAERDVNKISELKWKALQKLDKSRPPPIGGVGAIICTCHNLPLDSGREGPHTISTAIPTDPSLMPDVLLPITARLGLPLHFGPSLFITINQDAAKKPLIETPSNPVFHHLSTRKMPGSNEIDGAHLPGPVMLTRADGKDLLQAHVVAMWSFIDQALRTVREEDSRLGRLGIAHVLVPSNDRFCDLITPKAFIDFWTGLGLHDLEFPVTLACKACGKGKNENEKLLQCAKCGVVKYCNKKCQKDDWPAHKKVCVEG